MSVPNEAVKAAQMAGLGRWQNKATVEAMLEAAAPHMLAEAWASAYRLGVDDERTSQSNPGIAGCFCNSWPCQCVIEPARANPYRSALEAADPTVPGTEPIG